MSSSLERVTAALELREPDRVPTLDMLEEYSNIYEHPRQEAIPIAFFVTNRYAGKGRWTCFAPLINRTGVPRLGDGHDCSYDRADAAVKLGYDAAWVMHVPIWRFRDSK